MDPDLARLGYEAAALLNRLMQGETPPAEPVLIPPKGVVARESTDALAVEHPQVRLALQMIEDQYTQPLSIDTVCDAVAMSRRATASN